MVSYPSLMWLAVCCCLLVGVSAKDTPVSLEDIERDTLTSEKQAQQTLPVRPTMTTIQQLPPRPYFATIAPAPPVPFFSALSLPQRPSQASVGPHQFSPGARNFPPPPPLQLQFPNRLPQQQIAIQPTAGAAAGLHPEQLQQLLAQATIPVPSASEQQYSVPYLSDNSLLQNPYQQIYSQSAPQLVYLQPSSSSSVQQGPLKTSLQLIQYVDPNTEILRNPKTQQAFLKPYSQYAQNLAALIQKTAHTNIVPPNYRQPAPQTYRQQNMAQPIVTQQVYVNPRPITINPFYQRQNQILAQQKVVVPGPTPQQQQQLQQQQIQQYQQEQAQALQQQQAQQLQQQQQFLQQQNSLFDQQIALPSTSNVVYDKSQSLVGWYVPSAVQVQVYKQLQQQANAVPQDEKPSEVTVGKDDAAKEV